MYKKHNSLYKEEAILGIIKSMEENFFKNYELNLEKK